MTDIKHERRILRHNIINSELRRWMCFIDGENLTIRAQEFAKENNIILTQGEFFLRDVFIWFPHHTIAHLLKDTFRKGPSPYPIRTYYYTSVVGDEQKLQSVRQSLWDLGFQPEVFKKDKKQLKAKGVDIALAKDFLTQAFFDNYDVAFLFAGDGDYIPLLTEVKRLGKTTCVIFFSNHGLNQELKLAADFFVPIDTHFKNWWQNSQS